jgi:type 1 glutamine amidotransferase
VVTANALVVRGGWEGHAPVETTDLFLPFLRDQGYDVTVEDTLEVYADQALMARMDLILQCWTMGEILPDELRGLRTAVAAGTGLAGWHGGIVDSFRVATDYIQLTGAQFVAHPGDIVPYTVDVVPEHADHPIIAGIDRIELRSEQYWMATDPLIEVLATTTIVPGPDDPWSGPVTSPAVWTRQWGDGRIFVCTPGHQTADLEVPEIRTIIERGLVWATRQPTT